MANLIFRMDKTNRVLQKPGTFLEIPEMVRQHVCIDLWGGET